MSDHALGLAELGLVFGGFLLFIYWQRQELKRLKKERDKVSSLTGFPASQRDKDPPQR
jgi:hypothetical protein